MFLNEGVEGVCDLLLCKPAGAGEGLDVLGPEDRRPALVPHNNVVVLCSNVGGDNLSTNRV